jgi:Rieske 2Fe-2S family protein
MHKVTQVALLERALRLIEEQAIATAAPQTSLDALRYTSQERFDKERALLRRLPLIVGRVSEVPHPGSFLTVDACGIPLLIARDRAGQLRAFLNVCRHRGTVLCDEASGQRKAFVCRYHGWSYELSGRLMNVPLRATFPLLREEDHGLVELPLSQQHGFLIVVPDPQAPPSQLALGEFAADLEAFGVADLAVCKRAVIERACNWKLVLDAFLEGYHVKSLHRTTLARFFRDDGVFFDYLGPHVRSIGSRRDILDALSRTAKESWNIRDVATVYYLLYPNTILVFHPDWLSQIAVYPLAADRCRVVHTMLTPHEPTTDAQREHVDKTWALIHGQVFEQEDLSIAESVQRGVSAYPAQRLVLGALEHPIFHFHRSLDEAL